MEMDLEMTPVGLNETTISGRRINLHIPDSQLNECDPDYNDLNPSPENGVRNDWGHLVDDRTRWEESYEMVMAVFGTGLIFSAAWFCPL